MSRESRRSPSTLRSWLALATCGLLAAGCAPADGDRGAGVTVEGDWPVITGNLEGQRYTSLTQINPTNFADLEVAWEYDASHLGSVNQRSIPIYVDGMLINVHSEYRTVVALDAGTARRASESASPAPHTTDFANGLILRIVLSVS